MRFLLVVTFLLTSVALAWGGPALHNASARKIETNSAEQGLAYAEEQCSSCHSVSGGPEFSPNLAAPTFEELANTPGMSRLAFGVFLQTPHASMPNLIIEADQVDALWAYITTLELKDL